MSYRSSWLKLDISIILIIYKGACLSNILIYQLINVMNQKTNHPHFRPKTHPRKKKMQAAHPTTRSPPFLRMERVVRFARALFAVPQSALEGKAQRETSAWPEKGAMLLVPPRGLRLACFFLVMFWFGLVRLGFPGKTNQASKTKKWVTTGPPE